MAVTLIATPGAPNANSFTTREWANEYLSGQLFADGDWENVDDDQKDRALITATRLIIDAAREWTGYLVDPGQALPFPRSGVYQRVYSWGLYPTNVIPVELQQATAEYARQLWNLGSMPDSPSDAAGLKELKAGPVELVFDQAYKAPTGLPESIWNKISFLLASTGGSRINVPVYRT